MHQHPSAQPEAGLFRWPHSPKTRLKFSAKNFDACQHCELSSSRRMNPVDLLLVELVTVQPTESAEFLHVFLW